MNGERLDPRLGRVRADVRRHMSRGGSVDAVDAEIIEPSGFSADEKAALWLYAWSYVPRRMQRRWADRNLQMAALRS
ncbi:MAG TPA: hypothetical protein VF712_14105 [Thermoleophilaceae bacterium]